MITGDTLLDNRRSNTNNVENVDSANNASRSSHGRNPQIRFGKTYTH